MACVLFFAAAAPARAAIDDRGKETEARAWINGPSAAGALAHKRFFTPREVQRLIYGLYDAGALFVGVIYLLDEPDGLRVTLPLSSDLRAEIFKLVNGTLTRCGFSEETDRGQETLALWLR